MQSVKPISSQRFFSSNFTLKICTHITLDARLTCAKFLFDRTIFDEARGEKQNICQRPRGNYAEFFLYISIFYTFLPTNQEIDVLGY